LTLGANVRLQVANSASMEVGVRYEVLHANGGISGSLHEDAGFTIEISNSSIFLTRRHSGFVLFVR